MSLSQMVIDNRKPKFSIIIPTHNEEKDIRRTLDSVSKLDYLQYEVIIVDDASEDSTVEIMQEFIHQFGFTLIRQKKCRGVASARNRGIKISRGEILVILNADVMLDPDFLTNIEKHYNNGAEYLLVESMVINKNKLFPKFIQANHHYLYNGQGWINWTEGFSCLRKAAVDIGMFPEDIPGCGGEDAVFGENLEKKYKKVIDRSIVVTHVAPQAVHEFWRQRLSRGRSVLYRMYYVDKIDRKFFKPYLLGLTFIFIFKLLYLPSFLRETIRIAKKSSNVFINFFPFCYVNFLDWLGHLVGQWQAVFEIDRRD